VAPSGPRVDVARISPNGDVVIAGRAEPGAKVALLDNGKAILDTQADPASGEFVLLPPRLDAGAHQLSLRSAAFSDGAQTTEVTVQSFTISPQIKVATVASPAPSAPAEPPAAADATITRGDTLWRISRARLGRGSLYPTIVQANSTKIRNPDLIYPGDTLTIP
jgi:nucleoid-associated protein YgaU